MPTLQFPISPQAALPNPSHRIQSIFQLNLNGQVLPKTHRNLIHQILIISKHRQRHPHHLKRHWRARRTNPQQKNTQNIKLRNLWGPWIRTVCYLRCRWVQTEIQRAFEKVNWSENDGHWGRKRTVHGRFKSLLPRKAPLHPQ